MSEKKSQGQGYMVGVGGRSDLKSGAEGLSGMLITYSFSIWVLGPWAFLVMKIHQTVLLGHVHFFVCILYFDKNNYKNEKNSELKNPCLCAYTHKRGLPW